MLRPMSSDRPVQVVMTLHQSNQILSFLSIISKLEPELLSPSSVRVLYPLSHHHLLAPHRHRRWGSSF